MWPELRREKLPLPGDEETIEENIEETTTVHNEWHTNHNTTNFGSPFTNEQDVRIAAIELTMAFFQERAVTTQGFFVKAKQFEEFIQMGDVK